MRPVLLFLGLILLGAEHVLCAPGKQRSDDEDFGNAGKRSKVESSQSPSKRYCTDASCEEVVQTRLKWMDLSVNPCHGEFVL